MSFPILECTDNYSLNGTAVLPKPLKAKEQENAKQAHVVSFLSEAKKELSTRVPFSELPFPGRAGFDPQSVTAHLCKPAQNTSTQGDPKTICLNRDPVPGFRAGRVSRHTGKLNTVTMQDKRRTEVG